MPRKPRLTECVECKEPKGTKHFKDYRVKRPVCYTCLSKAEASTLKKEMAERKVERALESVGKRKASVKRVTQRTKTVDIESNPSENAQYELMQRELCRRRLLPYINRFVPKYSAGWVHMDICSRLEQFYQDVVDQKSPRLMLFMPPRAGKSEIASVNFPSWVFGKSPDFEIMTTSYAASLASSFSRKVRDRIKWDTRYTALFPDTKLSKSQENVEHWATTKGGQYIATGVGGPLSGKGAMIGIIDDPVKNREEADSELMQNMIWDWYRSTFYTRLEPGGGVLIIQTRWSDMDISQRLIDQMEEGTEEEVDHWTIVDYPGIAEEDEYIDLSTKKIIRSPFADEITADFRLLRKKDEALHPDRFNEEALKKRRNILGPREFSALYQQKPVPDSGDLFKKEWFIGQSPPSYLGMKTIIAGDLAIGKKEYHNKSAIVVASIDFDRNLHMREIQTGRWTAHEIVERFLNLYEAYEACMLGIENGAIKLALDDQFRLRSRQRSVFPTFDNELTPVTDKTIRSRNITGLMEAGVVFWPTPAPWWYAKALNQMLRFPAGKEDDIVDAMSWLGRMYHHVSPPRRPRFKNKQKSWKQQLKQFSRESRTHMSA